MGSHRSSRLEHLAFYKASKLGRKSNGQNNNPRRSHSARNGNPYAMAKARNIQHDAGTALQCKIKQAREEGKTLQRRTLARSKLTMKAGGPTETAFGRKPLFVLAVSPRGDRNSNHCKPISS